MIDTAFTPLEIKLAQDAPTGVFSGYAACFGNIDSHGDTIVNGAFTNTIAERKAAGRKVPMHLMHRFMGGDGVPVGVWLDLGEDSKGLRVEGKISGMNTDTGRLLFERVKDGALGGLSIGFKVRPNGAVYGKKAGEPKRTLTDVDLHEISLVDDPSNALTRVDEMKAAFRDEMKATLALVERDKLVAPLTKVFTLHQTTLTGGNSPTATQRDDMLNAILDLTEAITGERAAPGGSKAAPLTVRDVERILRDGGCSHSQARAIADLGFKQQTPRDEDEAKATAALQENLGQLRATLAGFSLPSF
jgi:HK97 family phage prohead protease